MESPEAVFTFAYLLFAICFLLTPTEFRSAGITVHGLLAGFLGSEDLDFVRFHMRRTAAALLLHSFLPFFYYLGLGVAAPHKNLFSTLPDTFVWRAFLAVAFGLPIWAALVGLAWRRNSWDGHPLAHSLEIQAPAGAGWRAAALLLNTEFCRIDKFSRGPPEGRVVVTDSWVVCTAAYSVNVALQRDAHLELAEARRHTLSAETSTAVQMLTVRVKSRNPQVAPFDIRLNSTEYGELREKLQAPIHAASNVVIHQTLNDLFLDAFRAQVELNPHCAMPAHLQEVEPCIGCMQGPANVKLFHRCGASAAGECEMCRCRPMWCLACMGRWFASRQDQQRPERWLSGRAPCPTCRAPFCVLDVSLTAETSSTFEDPLRHKRP
uniref:Transmembrane protein 129, E3 ubiquitin protein ligase n=1 Tax=Eptatretus burgeri TaxID=7764 RepID=A0A8C4QWG8_EPTBU